MIVDDRYFVIGSGNLNRRSMKTDTELGAAVVDKTSVSSSIKGTQQEVGELARAYRKNLWSEHLRQNVPDDPFDGDGHPSGFPKDDRLVGHVKRHEVPQPRFCNLSIIPFGSLKPEHLLLMKKVNKKVQSYPDFKGYSLSGFLDPKALTIDHVAANPNLLNAVMSHVMAFHSGANATGTNVRRDLRAGVADLSGRELVAYPGKTGNTFEGSLKDFLEGIYLGNFTSSALNAHPTRGAQQYIYDIGFNTDRRVGFIVDNPFDTLITFEPAERKRPARMYFVSLKGSAPSQL